MHAPRLEFLFRYVSQPIHLGGLASQCALGKFNRLHNLALARQRIGGRLGRDPDDADAGIVLGRVVNAVAQVAQPRLESRAVVLPDGVAVGDDGRVARHRGPFARGVEEGHVDVRVAGDVVRLARLGVGVEDQVDAVVLRPC